MRSLILDLDSQLTYSCRSLIHRFAVTYEPTERCWLWVFNNQYLVFVRILDFRKVLACRTCSGQCNKSNNGNFYGKTLLLLTHGYCFDTLETHNHLDELCLVGNILLWQSLSIMMNVFRRVLQYSSAYWLGNFWNCSFLRKFHQGELRIETNDDVYWICL